MKTRFPSLLLALGVMGVWTGCVSYPDGHGDGIEHAAAISPVTEGEDQADPPRRSGSSTQETSPPPQLRKLNPPPKPSLSKLKDTNRPYLDFYESRIYADSISGTEAKGHVYLDGTNLHKVNRSFPIAVYADRINVDVNKGRVTLSGWPIVQTDSAFVQAQSQDTVIVLNRDRMARIKGPTRYVIGSREKELFIP